LYRHYCCAIGLPGKRNNLETMMVNAVINAKLHIAKTEADISRRNLAALEEEFKR